MFRKLAIVAALAAATASGPALAQSSGGITLSFGTGGYNNYDYDDDYYYDRGGRQIYRPQFERQYRYNRYAQRAYERELQLYQWRLQQWRREQQRRYYWEQQRRNNHDWRYDHDDD